MYATKCTGALLGLVALGLWVNCEVYGGSKTKLSPAKTPEEAIKNVLTACQVGDLNLLLEQIAEPVRTQMWALMLREVARDDILQALHDKFGKDPQAIVPYSVKETLQQRKDIVIRKKEVANPDKYYLTVWVTEERVKNKPRILEYQWQTVKEKSRWKVLFDLGDGTTTTAQRTGADGKEILVRVVKPMPTSKELLGEVEYMKKAAPKLQAIVTQLLKDIKSGVYKTRLDAEKAIQAAEQRFVEENPPPILEKKKDTKKSGEKK